MGDGKHCVDSVQYLQADILPLCQNKIKGIKPLLSPAWNYISVHQISKHISTIHCAVLDRQL